MLVTQNIKVEKLYDWFQFAGFQTSKISVLFFCEMNDKNKLVLENKVSNATNLTNKTNKKKMNSNYVEQFFILQFFLFCRVTAVEKK